MIAVIIREESEPKLLPNANPTMALPFLAPFLVPQVHKKKLLQMKLWAKDDSPAPELNFIQVPSHIRGSSSVRDHRRYTTPAKSYRGKKKDKAFTPKKKTGQAKYFGFLKAKADCKETVQLATSLHIEYLKDLVNSF